MKKLAWFLCLAILAGSVLAPNAAVAALAAPSGGEAGLTLYESEGGAITSDGQAALAALAEEQAILALVYLSDNYNLRTGPSDEAGKVVTVPSGQLVQIQGTELDDYGQTWVRVSLEYLDVQYEGYIQRDNLACSDERFLAWEEEYAVQTPMLRSRSAFSTLETTYADILQFPESYQAALLELKQAHPNWTFVPMNTGLDWNTVVENELVKPRSLVPDSFPDYMKDGVYGQGWSYASAPALKYYLDPRNWLTEDYIFQFEQLTYNASYHSEAALQQFLNSSFMAGVVPQDGAGRTYAQLFSQVGQSLGVSPFHLATRVYFEQGVNGGSALITGTYPGYEGLYNYYNISASGSTNTAVVVNGLTKAREMGWTTPTLSIEGGAAIISANYILKGQDTLYLEKFDVEPNYNGLYWHQYMQAIYSPSSEALKIKQLYESAGSLDNTFVFKIPVYENMPEAPCALPDSAYAVSVSLPSGYSGTTLYLDGQAYTAEVINGQLVVDAGGTGAKTAVMYKYDASGVPVGMYVWTLSYKNGGYTATPVPELEDLLTYHGFSIRITGASGIRFKTGLSIDTRAKLLTTGLAGFTLKEYGTLVMTEANRSTYPFVKGGEKVIGGVAYGTTSSGAFVDSVFEAVGGRYRYTSVLVGLPAEQYKTEFAFRGYIILSYGGTDITIYGPPVSRSIYALAEYLLESGQYAEGSETNLFLRQLIADAG